MKREQIKKLVRMALLAATSVALVWLVHFPIFPPVGFLEYDPADIPILIGTFAYGPIGGIILTLVASVIQGTTVSAGSGIYGIIMHVLATSTLSGVSGLIYSKNKTRKGAVIGLVAGCISMVIVMFAANLLITPHFMGVTVEQVWGLMHLIVLFNLIKSVINSAVTFLIYKSISRLLK